MAQKWRPNLRTFSAIFFDWKDGSANFFAFRMYGDHDKGYGMQEYEEIKPAEESATDKAPECYPTATAGRSPDHR